MVRRQRVVDVRDASGGVRRDRQAGGRCGESRGARTRAVADRPGSCAVSRRHGPSQRPTRRRQPRSATRNPEEPGSAVDQQQRTRLAAGGHPRRRSETEAVIDYRDAGVNIDACNETVRRIRSLARSTFTPGVLSDIGSFGGLFALDRERYREPVLVSSADGVGTKLKIAFMTGRHGTIGADLVNHCVNDILVQGAQPLFFLDYLATGRLSPAVAEAIVAGVARACRENGCALIGGETAEMSGFYADGEYDIAGFIVGVVERSRVIDGRRVVVGDVLIGLPSAGLHTNGYSLARRVLFDLAGYDVHAVVPEIGATDR